MRIAIDGIAASHPQPGGYRTYVRNLVKALAAVDSKNTYLLMVDRPIDWQLGPNWAIQVISARHGAMGVAWREQFAGPRRAALAQADLIHFPCATGSLWCSLPTVVTIHDTIELTEPLPSLRHTKRWAMRLYSRFVQSHLAQRATKVIAVSQHSAQCVLVQREMEFLNVPLSHNCGRFSQNQLVCLLVLQYRF